MNSESMSAKQTLSHHLSDYLILIDNLLDSISLKKDNGREVMRKIIRKDDLMHDAVQKLVEHQQFQQKIIDVQREIAELDSSIVSFTSHLGGLEQRIHDAVTDEKTLKNLDGIITKQPFTVHDVTVFAERLAKMSFAPADYDAKMGMATRFPPNPTDLDMMKSKLHMSLEELLEEGKKVQQEKTEMFQKEGAGVVPSFAEIEDLVGEQPPAEWQPVIEESVGVKRPVKKKAPLLSLHLDSSEDSDSGSDNSVDDFGDAVSGDDFQ